MFYILKMIFIFVGYPVIGAAVLYGGICLLSWIGGIILHHSDKKNEKKEQEKEEFEEALAEYNDPDYEGTSTQADAAYRLSTFYYYGSGVKKDRKLSDKYMKIYKELSGDDSNL